MELGLGLDLGGPRVAQSVFEAAQLACGAASGGRVRLRRGATSEAHPQRRLPAGGAQLVARVANEGRLVGDQAAALRR